MLSLPELKKYYVRMYEELRNYLWDFTTVECLAELEVAVYRIFPDLGEVKMKFNRLYACISDTCARDEHLKTAVVDFKNTINSSNDVFSRLVKPKEA